MSKNKGAVKAVKHLWKLVNSVGERMETMEFFLADIDREITEIRTAVKRTEKKKPLLLLAVPKPCNGPLYANWTIDDYRGKVEEEFCEMTRAFKDWKISGDAAERKQFLRECTDVIVAVTSLMEKAGANIHERQQILCTVNQSNAVRDGGRRFAKEVLGHESNMDGEG